MGKYGAVLKVIFEVLFLLMVGVFISFSIEKQEYGAPAGLFFVFLMLELKSLDLTLERVRIRLDMIENWSEAHIKMDYPIEFAKAKKLAEEQMMKGKKCPS